MKSRVRIGAVVVLLAGAFGCDEPVPTAPAPAPVFNVTFSNIGNPINYVNSPIGNASPAPGAPGGGSGNTTITTLRITAIAGSETGGQGSRTWRVGTRFRLTATPNAPDDPCETLQPGQACPYYAEADIAWSYGIGSGPVTDTNAVVHVLGMGADTRYNLDLEAKKPGTFAIDATLFGNRQDVPDIKADTFVGTIVP